MIDHYDLEAPVVVGRRLRLVWGRLEAEHQECLGCGVCCFRGRLLPKEDKEG